MCRLRLTKILAIKEIKFMNYNKPILCEIK
ncbi:hypothetical protein NPD8_3290 [Clostridium botulinum]|nr:hypothetical protein NPD2_856 [Clostridium botulinum]APU61331.1 hypothetical protein NPD8_3290 [Clostridium botulinum]